MPDDDKTESVVQLHPDVHGMMLQAAEAAVPPEPEPEPATPPATILATAVATIEPDSSFPSQHIVYLGVVRNELEAHLMRFRNGLEMLSAKINGAQTSFEDEMRMLKDEYERKRQERQDSHLSEVTRLKVQIGDIKDVIETYEAAIDKVEDISERQAKADAAAEAAIKP